MKIIRHLVLMFIAVTLFSCGTEGEKKVESQEKTILSEYLKIKDQLVETNGLEASKAAKSLQILLQNEKDSLAQSMLQDAEKIATTEDTKTQRIYFNTLSQKMYTFSKANKKEGVILYKQFCPMAFKYEGAFWISTEKKVFNPYFGDEMLNCGYVKEEY